VKLVYHRITSVELGTDVQKMRIYVYFIILVLLSQINKNTVQFERTFQLHPAYIVTKVLPLL